MGLTVNLGLRRFFQFESDDSAWKEGLCAIVETGALEKVRDFVPSAKDPHRILEAVRTEDGIEVRELEATQAAQILEDIEALKAKHGEVSTSFSWDEAESYGMDIQDISAPFGPEKAVMELISINLGERARMVSIERSLKFNWIAREARCNMLRDLHALAAKHYLVIHAA